MAMAEARDRDARMTIPELQPKPALCARFVKPDKDTAVQEHIAHGRYGVTQNQ